MTSNDIIQWIEQPELLNASTLYELRTAVARYPFFQTLRMLYLKNLYLLHDETFGPELRKSALFISDRSKLYYLIEGNKLTLKPDKDDKSSDLLGEEATNKDRTLSLIDSFLSEMSDEQSSDSELSLSPPTEDYFQTEVNLSDEEQIEEEAETEELDDSYFTETLAKIYIKQRRYGKALEIIRKLNLKYPKKSIYFADQIRFLEKLVINEKIKS